MVVVIVIYDECVMVSKGRLLVGDRLVWHMEEESLHMYETDGFANKLMVVVY